MAQFAYGQGWAGWPPPPLTVRLTVKYSYFYDFPKLFVICVRFASSKHKVFVPVHICICLVLLCRRAQGHQDCGWVTFCYKVWQHRCSVCEKYFKHSLCHHAITCGDMGQHVLFLQCFLGYIICNLQFILQCFLIFVGIFLKISKNGRTRYFG